MLRRGATYVTSAILPIRSVDLTSLTIAHIVLILKAELFLRTTGDVLGGLHHEYGLVKEAV
jgi:hypothetical protein